MFRENVLGYGTSSIWNGNCEYDGLVDRNCRCDFRGKGGTINQLKSVMSNIMYHITDEAIHETFPNVRPYIVYHSGHCGIQRYAQTWVRDDPTCWDPLKYSIAAILDANLSGVAGQGCDIGGFYGPSPKAEFMVRWIQSGIFQPRFSVHSTNIDNTAAEPWAYGHCADYIREAAGLRYQLSPYLYSLMERAHEIGLPIMESMCSAFQEGVKYYREGVDFMFGDSLLVANVVEKGVSTRKVYLPEGRTFYDSQTRAVYEGGRTVRLPMDLESIPLFARSGVTIPMVENKLDNLRARQAQYIRILYTAGRDGRFTLYEDDGISVDYERGDYLKTSITVTAEERAVLDFCQEGRYKTAMKTLYLGMIRREKAPYWVRADRQTIPRFLHRRKSEGMDCGWYCGQRFESVQVKYPNPKKDYQVIVSFEQFDLIGM